jgi:NAD(P)-dependent dehydrogenase (short-subunit alcohol dehydrogenase family)
MRISGPVLITGSVSGIGKATARRALACGAQVVIHGIDQAAADAVCAELGAAFAVSGDLSDPAVPGMLIDQIIEKFGCIYGIVNNAANTGRSELDNTTVELFDNMMAVNVRAPLMLIQAAIPHMTETGGGRIVNIGSVNAWCGERNLLAYSISKGALLTLTRNLGDSLGPMGIRVNQVNPGWVLTDNEIKIKRAEGMPDDWPKRLPVTTAPSGGLIDPDELAATVCFFLSDLAPRVSGTVMDYEQYPVIGRNPPKVTV